MRTAPARPGIWGSLEREIEVRPGPGADGKLWDTLSDRVDITQLRPKLADDIEIKEFRLKWGNDYVIVGNPRDLIHYRFDLEDAPLLKLMDGTRTVKEIVLERFRESGDLELAGVADMVRQLYEGNFLEQRYLDVDAAVNHAVDPVPVRRQKAREFAKTLTIEWMGADRVVTWLYRHGLKYLFNKAVTVLAILFSIAGLVAFFAIAGDNRFDLAGNSLAIGFLVLLGLDYFMVFVHELGHALVLTHYGRQIKSAGFQIYFGSPAFFVESSDSLLMERNQQIMQSAYGPFAQFVIGAVASIIPWAYPDWVLSPTLYKFAVLNYLVLFMNLVPMLELDGYYILADAIQVPDLRERSLSFIRSEFWHKLRSRLRFTKQETGLAVYAILGIIFTVFSFYTSYFYWKQVFGGIVSRMWNGGTVTRFLLVALALFVLGPVIRGATKLVRLLLRRLRAQWRKVQFRLERSWRVEAAELIDALPVFDDVPGDVLSDLAGRVKLRQFRKGQVVVRQGERAEAFFVVRRGTLEVVEENLDTHNERTLRVLGRGESFGELGLATAAPRAATVRAATEAEAFEIDKPTFDRLLSSMIHVPHFAPTLQALEELRALPCFSSLEADELAELLTHGEWVNLPPGVELMRQGEPGDDFYAIGSGQVDVVRDGEAVNVLGPGTWVGEVALLLDVPRTATVRARTPVRAYRLDREGFDRLVAKSFRKGTLNPNVALERVGQH